MTLPTIVTFGLAVFVFIVIALCASWAWGARIYVLAVPLTVVFVAACFGLWWMMERWGT